MLEQAVPSLRPEVLLEVRSSAQFFLDALEAELLGLEAERDLATGSQWQIFPELGLIFSKGELLTQVVLDAGAIGGRLQAFELLVKGFLDSTQAAAFGGGFARLRAVVGSVPAALQQPIFPQHQDLSESHSRAHVRALDTLFEGLSETLERGQGLSQGMRFGLGLLLLGGLVGVGVFVAS